MLGIIFFPGRDGAHDLMVEVTGRFDLGDHLVMPLFWYVAIRTGRTHACTVTVVSGLLVVRVDELFHRVTADAELFGIGGFECPVEASPGDHADDDKKDCSTDRGAK